MKRDRSRSISSAVAGTSAVPDGQSAQTRVVNCVHAYEYDTSGRGVYIPANGRNAPVPQVFQAHSYPTYEAEGFIWVWWGDDPPDDVSGDLAPPRFFDDIGEGFTYKSVYDPWQAHYSRVIENQLDAVHLPFIHHNTIGRGERTVVDGPVVDWVDEGRFYVYVYNRADDGTPPRKASELPVPHPSGFRLEFIFPNLWQNRISDDVRIVAAFVPVDEAHTLLYLRFYQRFLTVPLLRDLVTWAAMPFNLVVAHQDRRVVETHQPQRSGLRIGERMIQGDRPVIEYRRRREELIQATAREKGET
jgi:phenylpropionate dioxygenase-like ring-hydroxylating dioxygenase large terminal subunit